MAITKIQSESLNLADDFAFTGTITGAGESNTPYFELTRITSNQTGLSDGTATKVQFNEATLDSDSGADVTTNYRYTVPSGKAGKYFLIAMCQGETVSSDDNKDVTLQIYKNGTSIARGEFETSSNNDAQRISLTVYTIEDLSVGDYIEVYIAVNSSSNVNTGILRSGSKLSGFRLTS